MLKTNHTNPNPPNAAKLSGLVSEKPLTIGIVAGEISGDILGADFMQKMNALHPNIRWVGVGGKLMAAQGLQSVIDMNRLSVMGLVEVLKHLPDLFRAKKEILDEFTTQKIDLFVGIDAPDFNLRLGKTLKKQGVFCVQYVSPSVWAWRENRIYNIIASTDLVLCLFPFELPVYQKHNHPAVCVGHPLLAKLTADKRPLADKKQAFIDEYGTQFASLNQLKSQSICMMAGSRVSEIRAILPILIDGMQKILRTHDSDFILPVVSQNHADLVKAIITDTAPTLLPRTHIIYESQQNGVLSISQKSMNVCDAVVLASGTATLETLLLERPMVVVYRLSAISYFIAKRLVKIPYVSLPNILSHGQTGQAIVPELIQHQATGDNIATHIGQILQNPDTQIISMVKTNTTLRNDSHNNPAQTVLDYFFKDKR